MAKNSQTEVTVEANDDSQVTGDSNTALASTISTVS